MSTAMRGVLGGGASIAEIALALLAPVLLTLVLAPTTLWLYLRR